MSSYTSRPPASARAARLAWDYFAATRPTSRPRTLHYSPNLRGAPGWYTESPQTDDDMAHWQGGSAGPLSFEALSQTIRAWRLHNIHPEKPDGA